MSVKAKAKVVGKVAFVFAVVGGALFGAMKLRDKLAGEKKPMAKWGAMARARVATVRLAPATVGTYVRKETYPGELAPPQTVDIAMKVGGRLTQVNGQLGESIERGTLIAEVENADIRSQLREAEASTAVQKAALARAEVDLAQWERELERKGPLFKKELLPLQDKETLEARRDQAKAQIELATAQVAQAQARSAVLRIQLDATRAHAPWTGKVARRILHPGAVVAPGAPILTLVDTDALVARFRVPEREAGDVKEGTAVDVVLDALGGEKLMGRVVRLAPVLDAASRTRLVEAEVTAGMRPIAPGMFVRAEVKLEERDGVTLVPRATVMQALSEKGETTLFRVAIGWKRLRPRVVAREIKVTLGKSMGDAVEVVEGLQAGESVIVEGHANLRHRDPVRLAKEKDEEKIHHRGTEKREEDTEKRIGGKSEDGDADGGVGAETGAGAGADAGARAGADGESTRRKKEDDEVEPDTEKPTDAGASEGDEKPKAFRPLWPRGGIGDLDAGARQLLERFQRLLDERWKGRGTERKSPFELMPDRGSLPYQTAPRRGSGWVVPRDDNADVERPSARRALERPSGAVIKRFWGGRGESEGEPEWRTTRRIRPVAPRGRTRPATRDAGGDEI